MSDSLATEPESDFVFVCACDRVSRSACAGQPFYKEHEGKRYCVLHFPGKEKSADFEKTLQIKLDNNDFYFRDVWFPDPLSFSEFVFGGEVDFIGATFNAKADFTGATFNAKADFTNTTFSGKADFREAIFSAEAVFNNATFRAAANFGWATFDADAKFMGIAFNDVDFYLTSFSAAAYFTGSTFSEPVNFGRTTFNAIAVFSTVIFSAEAHFYDATFDVADFYLTTFSATVDFSGATFSAPVDFTSANFKDYVKFAGDEGREVFGGTSSLNLQFARIEKPDLVFFHTLSLRPHWFVNVDARKFDFINVNWQFSTSQEIKELNIPTEKKVWHSGEYGLGAATHRLLAIAFRNLAVNAENNHRYEEASRFRYMAMDVRRRERWGGFALWRLSWWYWMASGYGERALRALLMLLGIVGLSALLHTQVGFVRWEPKFASESDIATAKRDEVGKPLPVARALTYSAAVMTFQKPEPRPATTAAQTVVLLETILGPVQAALLALAIRRKFMR